MVEGAHLTAIRSQTELFVGSVRLFAVLRSEKDDWSELREIGGRILVRTVKSVNRCVLAKEMTAPKVHRETKTPKKFACVFKQTKILGECVRVISARQR
jgi:hypothetical protein